MLLKRKGEMDPIKSLVPIVMGPPEAQAIIAALQGYEPPRPMTHDLLSNIIATLHADVVRIDIHNFHEGTFFAAITLAHNGVTFVVDARPSDAVALAVRTSAPLFMDTDVFNAASVETAALTQGGASGSGDSSSMAMAEDLDHPTMRKILDQIHNFAETVQPSDFKV